MHQQHAAKLTCFVFEFTEMTSLPDGTTPLHQKDLKELIQAAKRALALCAFSPADLDPLVFLAGPKLIVNMVPSLSAPANMDASDVHTICTDAVTKLNQIAAKLKHNAKQGNPLPIDVVTPAKKIVNLLRALASDGEEVTSTVTLESRGSKQSLTVLKPGDFTAAGDETAQRKTGNFRIIGLIRGEKNGAHQLVLAGGVRIELPGTPSWSWGKIHDVLDYEATMVGTLIRDSVGSQWSISSDSHVERQPPLL